MIKLLEDTRQAILLKVLDQKDRAVEAIVASHNVEYSILQEWIKKYCVRHK